MDVQTFSLPAWKSQQNIPKRAWPLETQLSLMAGRNLLVHKEELTTTLIENDFREYRSAEHNLS